MSSALFARVPGRAGPSPVGRLSFRCLLGVLALAAGPGCQKTAVAPDSSMLTADIDGSPGLRLTGSAIRAGRYAKADTTLAPASLVLSGISQDTGFFLEVHKFRGVGTYVLRQAVSGGPAETGRATCSTGGSFVYATYDAPGPVVGQVVVSTCDAAARHVQGTFRFAGGSPYAPAGSQVRQFTNGVFDIYDVTF